MQDNAGQNVKNIQKNRTMQVMQDIVVLHLGTATTIFWEIYRHAHA